MVFFSPSNCLSQSTPLETHRRRGRERYTAAVLIFRCSILKSGLAHYQLAKSPAHSLFFTLKFCAVALCFPKMRLEKPESCRTFEAPGHIFRLVGIQGFWYALEIGTVST